MILKNILKDNARIGIVNRGEAALRFIRAVKEYNALHGTELKTVALYIDKEENSPFVRMADDVFPLSRLPDYPGKQKSPYLDHELILAALSRMSCNAIWVGWGFVSEDSFFAEKTEAAGIVFLGPSSQAMALLGDKIAAKDLADKSDVPILPWSKKSVDSVEDARKISKEIGYPVIVKAANAGGGRGIRFVRTPEELEKQYLSARDETIRITGNSIVFIEYMVEQGRHLEVQVLADGHGNVNTFGVRDCSVQRKNQKIIEETPPPGFDQSVIKEMEAAAARLIRAADYVGAGTVEYLFDLKTNRYFFMEVNTRLQVEHPITETLYGIDLVKGQIDVARGKVVDLSDRKPNGCVIEVRLNAEDPDRDFSPAPGQVTLLKAPAGPGIRVDSGIEQYSDIPSEFDSMVAKIIAWGVNREETVSRLKRALREMRIKIKNGTTNRAFLLELLNHPAIMKGGVHTGFVEELLKTRKPASGGIRVEAALMAGAIELYIRQYNDDFINFQEQLSRVGRPRNIPESKGYEVNINVLGCGYKFLVKAVGINTWHIKNGDRELICQYIVNGQESILVMGGVRHNILMVPRGDSLQCEVDGFPVMLESDSGGYVKSPSPAIVLSISVKPGDKIKKGDVLIVLEAMKMEMLIQAPSDGVVNEICVIKGAQIAAGQALVQMDAGEQGAKAAGPVVKPMELTAVPRDDREEWERLKRNFHALFLGYDTDADPVSIFKSLTAFCRKNESFSEELTDVCLTAIHYFNAVEKLFTPKVFTSESFARPMTGQELLSHYFRRDEEKGLPEDFLNLLGRAIDCYAGAGLWGNDPKSFALFHIFRAHGQIAAKQELLKRVLFHLVEELSVSESLHEHLGKLLDKLILLNETSGPSVADAAIYARYQIIDLKKLEKIKTQHYQEIDAMVDRISSGMTEDFISTVEDSGPYIIPELVQLALAGDKGKEKSALTILGRRMNRDREDLAVTIREASGNPAAMASGKENGRTVCSLTAVIPESQLKTGITLTGCGEAMLFVACKAEGNPSAILFESLSAIKGDSDCRLTVGLVSADRKQLYRTFVQAGGQWSEDIPAREFSPLQYRELRVFRLRNFTLNFIYKTDSVFLVEATALENKKDIRLIALVDVSELGQNPANDTRRLVLFDALYMEGVYAMRAAQAQYKFRLHWNRIIVHIPALLNMGIRQLQEYGDRLLVSTRDLGLEKLVVYSRRKRWSEDKIRELEISFSEVAQGQCLFRSRIPSLDPLTPFDDYVTKAVRARQRDTVYPYELIKMITRSGFSSDEMAARGNFEEYDITINPDGGQSYGSVKDREPGRNDSNIVFGIITNSLSDLPVPVRRVIILSDSTNDLGSLAEPECRRINAALDLAEREKIPAEWVPVSSGAKINMDSGTENLDWTAATLRRIIEYTQNGGELNIIVPNVNVGAQSYWNAEATMLMHTRGILIMTDDASMLLTGKRALDFSGSVSGETNLDIGGAEKIMAPNGQAQFRAGTIADAYKILFDHYRYTYVPAGEVFPPKTATEDKPDRDISQVPYKDFLGQGFATIGDIFSFEKNPERKKPFDIRQVMKALIDTDTSYLERWKFLQDSDTAIIWESRMGGNAVGMIGIESRNVPRIGEIPFDGPESWSGGTLFPLSSKKVARAINAFSGHLPLVLVANLSGFDGSPESLRRLQLEYGAEIGRAIVNFKGPISFVVVARYHGGAYVVFSKSLNPNLRAAALKGSYASVIGGAPAAAVVFPKAVTTEIYADERIIKAQKELKAGQFSQKEYDILFNQVRNEKQARLGQEFDKIHSVERARTVGSIDDIITTSELRPYIIRIVEEGMKKHLTTVKR
jgi:acetyl/propionyl-CoA carboxylase alpha subunit/acetyl-CoA carboxylase carboxyltransferase component